jgi:hypothetical protein
MKLPDDASIEEVAMVFGVHRHITELTPAARKLTKGEMVAILGADNELDAVRVAAASKAPRPQSLVSEAKKAGVDLTAEDIQSVQKVFGTNFTASEKQTIRGVIGDANTQDLMAAEGWTVYVCCCPCCCATTVLEPGSATVA